MAVQAKAKNKLGQKGSRSTRIPPFHKDFFQFAELVALVFDKPKARHLRSRLFHEASAYRNRYRPHRVENLWASKAKWAAFLLRLILACPRILSRPPDFEWVMDDLEWILARRKFHPGIDRDFWEAVDLIRGPIRTGHPRNRALDIFRFETIETHMNVPAPLKGIVDSCGKEEALRRVADLEEKFLGKRPHQRVVRRSYDRVHQELTELNSLLGGKYFTTQAAATKRDVKTKQTGQKTSNQTKRSNTQYRHRDRRGSPRNGA